MSWVVPVVPGGHCPPYLQSSDTPFFVATYDGKTLLLKCPSISSNKTLPNVWTLHRSRSVFKSSLAVDWQKSSRRKQESDLSPCNESLMTQTFVGTHRERNSTNGVKVFFKSLPKYLLAYWWLNDGLVKAISQMLLHFSAEFVCPNPEVWDFWTKNSLWVSIREWGFSVFGRGPISNVVGIICPPPGCDTAKWSAKIWGPQSPGFNSLAALPPQ